MANNRAPIPDNADDRREVIHEGSSLSGSNKRNNDATEKANHPEKNEQNEVVDQDPGERQKRNQGGEKEDPLAA